ncbi:DEAD-box ATP-dependent RNA helicase [Gryganskiella cystojenkinii]|nr:DEAD-box ATP-dependent RNA helicase [Gryganskiella cystojenkinii]
MNDTVGKWGARDMSASNTPQGWASDSRVYEWRPNYTLQTAPDDPELLRELFSEETRVSSGINFKAYADMQVSVKGGPLGFKPAMTFEDARLESAVLQNVQRMHYAEPTPIQKNAVPLIVQNYDLMACAQTGSGKTAAFLAPIISSLLTKIAQGRVKPVRRVPGGGPVKASPMALIILPTRELAIQIFRRSSSSMSFMNKQKKFTYKTPLRPGVVYGGSEVRTQLQQMSRGCDILVAVPGRLKDMIERGSISLAYVRHLVLDEADRMLDMGFEADIRQIVNKSAMPQDEARQTLMFSATFPNDVQHLARDFLKDDFVRLRIGRIGGTTSDITQRVLYVRDSDKRDTLVEILMTIPPCRTLIFVETKRAADGLDDFLYNMKFPTVSIHGDRDQREREKSLKAFKEGKSPILIATAVASRGLDIRDVNHIINYDLCSDIDDYVHRIGRTARAGNQGLATSFYNDKHDGIAPQLTKILQESNQEIPDFLQSFVSEHTSYETDDFFEEPEQGPNRGQSSSAGIVQDKDSWGNRGDW